MGAGHGANFLNNYLYDGEEIAARGNVIVVTFNYRVGPLGFLSTGDPNLPGLPGALSTGVWGSRAGTPLSAPHPQTTPDSPQNGPESYSQSQGDGHGL